MNSRNTMRKRSWSLGAKKATPEGRLAARMIAVLTQTGYLELRLIVHQLPPMMLTPVTLLVMVIRLLQGEAGRYRGVHIRLCIHQLLGRTVLRCVVVGHAAKVGRDESANLTSTLKLRVL